MYCQNKQLTAHNMGRKQQTLMQRNHSFNGWWISGSGVLWCSELWTRWRSNSSAHLACVLPWAGRQMQQRQMETGSELLWCSELSWSLPRNSSAHLASVRALSSLLCRCFTCNNVSTTLGIGMTLQHPKANRHGLGVGVRKGDARGWQRPRERRRCRATRRVDAGARAGGQPVNATISLH